MAKKEANRATKVAGAPATSLTSIIAGKASVDPALDSLFASSSGPVKKPSKKPLPPPSPEPEVDDEDLSEASENVSVADEEDEESADVEMEDHEAARSKKRKRKNDDEELEDVYLRKLARLEEKEASQRKAEKSAQAQPATATSPESDDSDEDEEGDEDDEEGSESTNEEEEDDEDDEDGTDSADNDAETSDFEIPQHETLAPSRDEVELDKAARTVFLGNVSTEAITSKTAKKTLMQHLASFIPSLPADKAVHKVESLRFRSTPYASAIPKKAAFAKKELMDATTKSTNAYAVYSTQLAAKEAAKRLNGTVVLNRHLRVDLVAHPAKVDHRRCVFVGNLGFVDDETSIQSANEEDGKKKKNKTPGDVEEGLWQQFSKAGPVESVRVVRDAKTRVGKGFAYVQFKDENGVEAALLFNDKKFPPLLPRTLRVVRAKAIKRKDIKKKEAGGKGTDGVYKPKPDARRQSYLGRAGKLLGRAGAAQARSDGGFKKPEEIIFEGHRASAAQGKAGFKFNKSKKKGGKPQNRSSKRAAAWKAAGGKKKA